VQIFLYVLIAFVFEVVYDFYTVTLEVETEAFAQELIKFIIDFRLVDLEVKDGFCPISIDTISLT
jgi:hypothetical protein